MKILQTVEHADFKTAADRPESARTRPVRLSVELGTRSAPPPDIESAAPFYLKAHHERWTVIGGQVVPQFGKLKLQPGLNGASEDERTKRLLFKVAQGQAEERDWVIIPWEAVPPEHLEEGEEPSYMVQVEGRPDVYLLRYERVFPGSSVRGTDEKGFLEFCAYLLEQGLIKPPPLYVLSRMLEQKQSELARASDKSARTGRFSLTVKRLEADVAALEKAIEGRQEPARTRSVKVATGAPEPVEAEAKPRSRRSKAAAQAEEA